jgi:RND family efflux transporter MFP subunit
MLKKLGLAILGLSIISYSVYSFAFSKGTETSIGQITTEDRIFELNEAEINIISPQNLSETIKISGTLKAVNSTIIRAKTAGTIENVFFKIGDKVKKGDVLVTLENDDQIIALAESSSNVKSAIENLNTAKETLARTEILNAKGYSSTAALDKARSDKVSTETSLEISKAQFETAKKATIDTVLDAPHDGVVSARRVEPAETVAANTDLLAIVDITELEIVVNIPTRSIAHVSIGDEVNLGTDVSNVTLAGEVVRIAPVANEETRSVLVFLKVMNPNLDAWPGTFATGEITTRSADNVIAIPIESVLKEDAKTYVLKVHDSKIVKVEVHTESVWENGKTIVISDGISKGDTILSRPLRGLAVGDNVKIVKV